MSEVSPFSPGMSARRGVDAPEAGSVMGWWMLSFSLSRLRLDRKTRTGRFMSQVPVRQTYHRRLSNDVRYLYQPLLKVGVHLRGKLFLWNFLCHHV